MQETTLIQFIPVAIMFALALGFVGLTMAATHLLGPKRKTQTKLEAFECGIESTGNARLPFNIKYFLVAILFVLFDVEVIFLYPWAIVFNKIGLIGLVEMLIFIGLFLVAYVYAWRKGALEWD